MSPIARLRGPIEERGTDWLIVAVGGLSFKLQVSTTTLSVIGAPGDEVALHTHLQVRDDRLVLFGFATAAEVQMFELLIGVSGIGPKAALALLSAMNSDELASTIAHSDISTLSRVSGIGRRTAERLVLELRDKLQDYGALASAAVSSRDNDVVAALTSLGYTRSEAEAAAVAVSTDTSLPTEEKIRLALQSFARQWVVE